MQVEHVLDLTYRYKLFEMGEFTASVIQVTNSRNQPVIVLTLDAYNQLLQNYPDRISEAP